MKRAYGSASSSIFSQMQLSKHWVDSVEIWHMYAVTQVKISEFYVISTNQRSHMTKNIIVRGGLGQMIT